MPKKGDRPQNILVVAKKEVHDEQEVHPKASVKNYAKSSWTFFVLTLMSKVAFEYCYFE